MSNPLNEVFIGQTVVGQA